jgi:hypothetical protein
MSTFNDLFEKRTSSILLEISSLNLNRKSKLGGMPPAYIDNIGEKELKDEYYYLFTLSDEFSEFIGGKDLSVFIPKDYSNYGASSLYPELNVKCFIHEQSVISTSGSAYMHPELVESSLIPIEKGNKPSDEEYSYFIKIGSVPYLLQDEAYFYRDLASKSYQFIFQLDENGLTEEYLKGNYPFGFGAVYFYGTVDEGHSLINNVIAGFWQK